MKKTAEVSFCFTKVHLYSKSEMCIEIDTEMM